MLVIDPITPEARDILKLTESFVVHLAPIRLGIIFDLRKSNENTLEQYRGLVCAFNYVSQKKSSSDALGFLTDVNLNLF